MHLQTKTRFQLLTTLTYSHDVGIAADRVVRHQAYQWLQVVLLASLLSGDDYSGAAIANTLSGN